MKGQVFTIEEGLHSDLGPSSSERWMGCPGSVLASKGLKGQSSYAAEGTAAHELSKWVRQTGLPADHWKGATLVVGDYSFKVGKPMVDSVNRFVADCAAIEGEPYFEEMVHYEHFVPGGFGTGDDFRIKDNLCTITDLKHGTGVLVHAKENSQLKLYALGTYLTFGWLFDFDKFHLKICQPRLKHFEGFEISLRDLLHWAGDVVRPAAKTAMTPGAPIVAGSWCKFCKLRDTCQVRIDYKRLMKGRERQAESEFEDMSPQETIEW